MDDLADIFPPPAPAAAEAGAALTFGSWALAVLVLGVVAGAWLWRRRLALEAWWLARLLRRGRCEPREAARDGLRLMRRAFGSGIAPDLDETRRGLDAGCYGREPPQANILARDLDRLRARL
ncbi:hypothetical protein B1C78_11490 [Thioalkalivibrio denitrificans]|uniref:DUF4381 domain-containing protein n=1 Tax=Thioalkalivibrio denitrificans TaxID=108003 RepID=A0A1V3NEE2_9GAMM|nr:hypothetical protein [Thioalkalivibrio denitrificans]OOG23364.1 hypothetical protein B1C78_11490 [Thioalkalivibrio denitrificans]